MPGTAPGRRSAELEALLFVAERPLSRREIGQLCGLDRDAVDTLLGDLEVALRDRGVRLTTSGEQVELATAPEAGPLIGRYVGGGRLRASRRPRWRRSPSWPTASRSRGGSWSASGASIPTTSSGACCIAGSSSSRAARTRPGRPILYATSFEFMERFGLTSLDDLPPLDAGGRGAAGRWRPTTRRPAWATERPRATTARDGAGRGRRR